MPVVLLQEGNGDVCSEEGGGPPPSHVPDGTCSHGENGEGANGNAANLLSDKKVVPPE